MNEHETSPQLRIPCHHLRSKEMYYQDNGQQEDEFASGVFWCTKTHEGFGPDGQPVAKTHCCAGRSCFVN